MISILKVDMGYKNDIQVVKYYEKSAKVFDYQLYIRLAELYTQGGYGIEQDKKKAEQYYIFFKDKKKRLMKKKRKNVMYGVMSNIVNT